MEGPEIWLNELGVTINCPVRRDAPAIFDVAHCVFVNWETFYFADARAKADFVREPYRFSGKLTDPVSRDRFQPSGASPRREFGGRAFFFASEANAERFDLSPESYEKPVIGMREMRG